MEHEFVVYVQKQNGSGKDITEMLSGITWSGDYKQCSRKLEFDVLYAINDSNQPVFLPDIGDKVVMSYNGTKVFSGVVWDRDLTSKGQFIKVTCMDYMIYVNKSTVSYNFKDTTAEDITAKVCGDLGLPISSLEATGVKINLPAINKNAYDVIMMAYTKAAEVTGKKYMPTFAWEGVAVIEKGNQTIDYHLDYDYNIEGTQFTESMENMVSRVIVLDDKGSIVNTVENSEWIQTYGIIQAAINDTENSGKKEYAAYKDIATIAKNTLKAPEKKANVDALGNIAAITGAAVVVTDKHTGLNGLFYIDGDSHTYVNNVYEMKLTLSFENLMDSNYADAESSSSSSSKSPSENPNKDWLDNWEVDKDGNVVPPAKPVPTEDEE